MTAVDHEAGFHRSGWLAAQLPPAILMDPETDDPFLPRFLRIFEDISESIQDRIDGIEHVLDVETADLAFVQWIGGWLGVEVDTTMPAETQRRVVRAAGRWLSLRGTVAGLEGFVSDITGSGCRVIDSGGTYGPGGAPTAGSEVIVEVSLGDRLSSEQLQILVDASVPTGTVARVEPSRTPPPFPRSRNRR